MWSLQLRYQEQPRGQMSLHRRSIIVEPHIMQMVMRPEKSRDGGETSVSPDTPFGRIFRSFGLSKGRSLSRSYLVSLGTPFFAPLIYPHS